MKKKNNAKLSLGFATAGLILSCINLIISEFQSESGVLFCCSITIWICNLENYRRCNGKNKLS